MTNLEAHIRAHCIIHGLSFPQVAQALRAAVWGDTVSPPIFEAMQILGQDEVLKRVGEI